MVQDINEMILIEFFFFLIHKKHVINVVCAYEWNIYLKLIPHSSAYKIPQKIMAHCIAYGIFFLGRNFNHKKNYFGFRCTDWMRVGMIFDEFPVLWTDFNQILDELQLMEKFKRVEWHPNPKMTMQKWFLSSLKQRFDR